MWDREGAAIFYDPGVYAVVSGYSNSFAPGDTQENRGFDRSAGEAVYLSGMPGLPAACIPCYRALRLAARRVRRPVELPVPDLLPGQVYTMRMALCIVPGYVTDSRSVSGGRRDALWSGFEVLTREQVLQRSEIMLTHASSFFADSIGRPQDGGLLSLDTSQGLKLDAIFQLAAAEGGRGAAVDINAANIVITNGRLSRTPQLIRWLPASRWRSSTGWERPAC